MSPKVPVLVVGGFLGSGKTTLVRRLLADAQARGLRMAVISNEFGEIGIDAALLGAGDVRMIELAGGCVCCSLSNELVETLVELRHKVDPDRIVIETSGLALPFDTQLHLYRPKVREWVGDEACIVVVDAERADEADPLFADQVQGADLVLLSKVDLVDEATRARAVARLAELAPDAPVIEAVRGEVSVDLFYPRGPRAEGGAAHGHAPGEAHDHDHAHGHAGPHAHDAWTSTELRVPAGLPEAEAYAFVEARRGVRTKGFVDTAEGVRLVQGVGRRLELTAPEGPVAPGLLGRVVVIRRA
jgi:G3E family GTPase